MKYYDVENVRWAYLFHISPSHEEISSAVSRWMFFLEELSSPGSLSDPLILTFGTGRSMTSWASKDQIYVANGCSWLTVAHEFAHVIDYRLSPDKKRRHDARHRRLTDILCLDIIQHIIPNAQQEFGAEVIGRKDS